MEKIDKLQQLMKLLQNDTITPQEVEKFLIMVVEVVKKAKDSFERISSENLAQVSEFLEYMQSEHERILSRSQNAIDIAENTLDTFDAKLAEAKSLVAKLRIMEPKNGIDGKDADEEYIISEVLNRIQLPEPKEIELDTGEDIVEKINQLSTDEKYQIDASHIKNLPQSTGGNLGSTVRNLWQLSDVTIDEPTNGQALKYNSTTGQWENGTDSASPGGSDTQVQFNDNGVFGGSAGLVYNKTTRQLSLVSQDIPNGVARLQLNSYDETSTSGGDYSEVIRMDMMTNSAKAALAWRDSAGNSQVWAQAHDYLYWYESIVVSAVDTSADTLTVVDRDMPTGWQVTLTTTGTLPDPLLVSTNYYVRVISANVISLYPTSADASANTNKINLTTSGSGTITVVPDNDYNYNRHKHWSVEVSKANGEKHTRFSIPYGYDTTEISVFDANMNVIGNMFRVLGNSGNNRQILFGQNPPNSYLPGNYGASPRWSLTCNDTAESGSNVGSDYQINRFGDNGAYIASALFIKRDTGNIGIATTSPQARFHVDRTTNAVGILSLNSTAGGNTAANFLGESVTSGSRVYQARITGDTTARWSVDASGNTEWGAGGASARDTNLYRASADNLKTDDNFTALSLISSGSTASRVAQFDANKKLESSSVTNTELGYVSGVTSAIQAQINTIVSALTVVAQPDVGNSAGGADTTVYSFTVPANTIDGSRFRGIRINLSCALSSTAETTTFKVKLNGVQCSIQSTANTNAVLTWYTFVIRSSSTTARSFGDRITTAGGASGDGNNSISGLDFTADQTFAITIASSTANRGTLSNLLVEYI